MAVNDDVDLVVFEHAQVYLAQHRRGCAEEDILKLGGNHTAAPTVGQ